MADDDDSFWGDVGKAIVEIAVAYAEAAIQNALFGPKAQKPGMPEYSIPDSRPVAIYPVGDYAPVAPAYALFEVRGQVFTQVVACSAWELQSFNGFFLNDDRVTTNEGDYVDTVNGEDPGRYTDDRVIIKTRLGAAAETLYSDAHDEHPTLWTTSHIGNGIGSAMMMLFAPKAKFQQEAFPYGPPRIRPVCRAKFYDWRDTEQVRSLPSTWKWSANVVVVAVNLEWRKYGLDWDAFIAPVLDDLTVEAGICDEAVALASGGFEPRYRCGGNFRDDEDVESVRARLRECMDGYITRDGRGRLVVKCGRWEEPDITLTAEHILSVDWKLGLDENQSVAALNVSYTAPDLYTRRDCQPQVVDVTSYKTEDFYPVWCQSFSQARRLAKIKAADMAPSAFGTIVTDEFGHLLMGKRFIRVQNPDNPEMADICCKVQSFTENDGIFTFTVREASAADYSWSPTTEEGEDPGSPTTVTATPLPTPTIASATAFYETIAEGATGVGIVIAAGSGTLRSDLSWFSSWKTEFGTTWTDGFAQDGHDNGTADLVIHAPLPTGASVNLDVRVAYRTSGGVLSAWSDSVTVSTSTGMIAPLPPVSLTLNGAVAGQVTATWQNPASLNFYGARLWRNGSGAGFATATNVGALRTAAANSTDSYIDTGLTAGSYDYWVTAENSHPTQSSPLGPVTVTVT